MSTQTASLEDLLAHRDWVQALARRLLGNTDEADEVVQDTWLAAIDRPPEADRPLRPWLATVVRNFVRQRARHRQVVEAYVHRHAREASAASPEQALEQLQAHQAVVNAVVALPEPMRTAILLRYYEGLDSKTIANRLGTRSATVRKRIERGLIRIREQLDRQQGGEAGAWVRVLLPLAGAAPAKGPPIGTALMGGWKGGLWMSSWLKWGMPIVALLFAVVYVGFGDRFAQEESFDEASVSASPATRSESAAVPSESIASEAEERRAMSGTISSKLVPQVRGKLRFDSDRSPVAGVTLTAQLHYADQTESVRVTTDAKGDFDLVFENEGVLRSVRIEAGPSSVFMKRVVHHRVVRGEEPSLELTVHKGATVHGRVVDERGRPVSGALVRAWCHESLMPEQEEPTRETTSDEAGRFQLSHLGHHVTIEAARAGFVCRQALYGQRLTAGQLVREAELVLTPARSCRFRMVDPQSRPISGVLVEVFNYPSLGQPISIEAPNFYAITPARAEAVSDADGRVEIGGLPDAPSYLRFKAEGFQRHAAYYTPGLEAHEVVLQYGVVVAGVVRGHDGRPAAAAKVSLVNEQRVCDAEGRFEFKGLAPNEKAYLRVLAPGHAVEVRQPIEIGREAESWITVSLQAESVLAGRVVDEADDPVAFTSVHVRGDRLVDYGDVSFGGDIVTTWEWSAGLDECLTDADGRFRFEQLYPGRFVVTAALPDQPQAEVEVVTESGREDLVLKLERERALKVVVQGVLRDALSGQPIAGAEVIPWVETAHGGATTLVTRAKTDAQGRYTLIGLEPERMRMRFSAADYADRDTPFRMYELGAHELDAELYPQRTVRLRFLGVDGHPLEKQGRLAFLDEDGTTLWVGMSTHVLVNDGLAEAHGLPAKWLRMKLDVTGQDELFEFDLDLRTQPVEVLEFGLNLAPESEARDLILIVHGAEAESSAAELLWLSESQEGASDGGTWPIDARVECIARDVRGRILLQGRLEPLPQARYRLVAQTIDGEVRSGEGGFRLPMIPMNLSADAIVLELSAAGFQPLRTVVQLEGNEGASNSLRAVLRREPQ